LLNVNSNQLNQSKIKNIEDGAKGSGFFFFFFYCKRCSGACCVVGFSCSKLRSRTSSGACCVATASSHALELVVATQQALMLWSLLHCSKQAPEFAVLQGLVAASKLRSREAPEKLRSLELACLFKQNKQK
jgi:hypothetical protein